MQTRQCRACQCTKPIDDFANAGTLNGVRYWRHLCKPCYGKQKDVQKKRSREWYKEYKKTLACVDCGIADYRVLEFDHLNSSDKMFNVSDAAGRVIARKRLLDEINKCEVVCANCHRIRTHTRNLRSIAQPA